MSTPHGPSALRSRAAYQALKDHHERIRKVHLRDLFADDSERGTRMSAEAGGLFLDFSKNRVTDETLRLLIEFAEQSGLRERIDAMFSGEHINTTEDRAVLHVALRAPAGVSIVVDRIRDEAGAIDGGAEQGLCGSALSPVSDSERPNIKAPVDELLAEHPDELKAPPGKMVDETQPKLDERPGPRARTAADAVVVVSQMGIDSTPPRDRRGGTAGVFAVAADAAPDEPPLPQRR